MKARAFLLFLAIGVLFSACESRDAKWRKAMAGSWQVNQTAPGVKIVGTLTLGADGTMHEDVSVTVDQRKGPLIYDGTWRVADGYYVATIDKSSVAKFIPKERTTRSKILKVTDRELVIQNEKTGVASVLARMQ